MKRNVKFILGALVVGASTLLAAAGLYTNNLPQIAGFTGNELIPADTRLASGAYPQTEAISMQALAAGELMLSSNADVVGINGQRFSGSYYIGTPTGITTQGGSVQLTGIEVLVGTTGGTDKWIVELHNSTGALVATSATAGTTAGTASTWQQIPFTAVVNVTPGQYFLTLQSNGTTAKFRAYNAPVLSNMLTQSASGTFGTSASITPPTTYTASQAPVALPY